MHKTAMSFFLLVGMLAGGCINQPSDQTEDGAEVSAKTSGIYAVVIGMENSQFAGACPGAGLDADRMYSLISQNAIDTVLLKNEKATHYAVKSAIQKGIERSGAGLFMLYYSGHGGSDPFPDTGIEETDGRDEYLCLYDRYMRDNEIWSLICQSKCEVWIMVDACHSRTMFRSPAITLTAAMPLKTTWNESGPITMQCWSGCPDDTYSYGSDTGGQFTNAFLRHYKPNMTYGELWALIESDPTLKVYEKVQRTIMGRDFSGRVVFH